MLLQRCRGSCPDGSESEIVEADIIIHPSPPRSLGGEECLRTTLQHEAGHFLGVPHLERPALMAPVVPSCSQQLTDMDREALAELYP